jgi:hypothetical protein
MGYSIGGSDTEGIQQSRILYMGYSIGGSDAGKEDTSDAGIGDRV